MKILDRYILRTLLTPLFYCLMAFGLLYIIYDLFDNLPDFIDARTPILLVVKFYVLLLPSVLIFVVPVSLILSVLYSLLQLTKHNEVTAMRASGVSIYRVVRPCIGIGLAAGFSVSMINETAGPWCAHWTQQFLHSEKHKDDIDVNIVKNLPYMNVMEGRIWMVGRFDTKSLSLEQVEVTQQRDDGTDAMKIQAAEARWLDGHWWFIQPNIQYYDRYSNPKGPPLFEKNFEAAAFNETPKTFLNETKMFMNMANSDAQNISAMEIYHYIETHPFLDENLLNKYRVDFHHRLAMPWMCLVVTLIGIPFGTYTGRKGALLGIVLCLVLFFIYYTLINVGLWAGKGGHLEPWLAAWTPNLLFFVISLALLLRIR